MARSSLQRITICIEVDEALTPAQRADAHALLDNAASITEINNFVAALQAALILLNGTYDFNVKHEA